MDSSSDYADLISLFQEFREFLKPEVIKGVPDYTAAAMEEKHRGVKKLQDRLAAIDISGWPVLQQVDYHVVRAEMNGVDFEHRVLRPWACDPGFYNISDGMYPRLNVHYTMYFSGFSIRTMPELIQFIFQDVGCIEIKNDPAIFKVYDNGQVFMPFGNSYFINAEYSQILPAGIVVLFI